MDSLSSYIFAIETDEQTLYVFPNEESAISSCEALDVEAAVWLFWDSSGLPLSAEFSAPNKRGIFSTRNGVYHLTQAQDNLQAPLIEALEHVKNIDDTSFFGSLSEVKKYLISKENTK